MPPISLVIPIRDEEASIGDLIESISRQTLQPDEIIFVDGGSTDSTTVLVERAAEENSRIKLIKTDGATPGKGRNIGIEAAVNQWIALTDAGIELNDNWLEELVNTAKLNPAFDFIYGYVDTVIKTTFDLCATLAYVPPPDEHGIRPSIASTLMKRCVWEGVGGFPDLRAAEDLIFMEGVAKRYNIGYAPSAVIHWHLRPDFRSTLRKFILYSKFNVLAGRQRNWHYGILKQYAILSTTLLLAVVFSWWFLLLSIGWLFARTIKRLLINRKVFGWTRLAHPTIILGTMAVILTIDIATFIGWGLALRGDDRV